MVTETVTRPRTVRNFPTPARNHRNHPEESGTVVKRSKVSKTVQKLTGSLTLSELADRFMQSRRQGSTRSGRRLSPKTLRFYRMCLDGLLDFSAQADWPAPEEITRDHLRDFRQYLDTETCRWKRCT